MVIRIRVLYKKDKADCEKEVCINERDFLEGKTDFDYLFTELMLRVFNDITHRGKTTNKILELQERGENDKAEELMEKTAFPYEIPDNKYIK